jgi:hypothetical protein
MTMWGMSRAAPPNFLSAPPRSSTTSINCNMSDAPPAAAAPSEAPQGEAPSKNALKKAQKEKEKVRSGRVLRPVNVQLTS